MKNIFNVYYEGDLRASVKNGDGLIETDLPIELGGIGDKVTPKDLLAISYGMCVITMMGLYASKIGLDMGKLSCEVKKEDSVAGTSLMSIEIIVNCSKKFDKDVKEKLERFALDCPIGSHFHPDLKKKVVFNWG